MYALKTLTALYSLIIALLASPICAADDIQDAIRIEVEQLRINGHLSLGDIDIASTDLLAEFYESRQFQPTWVNPAQSDSLIQAIRNSYLEGFNPEDYHLEKILRGKNMLERKVTPRQRAVIDLAFTDSLIRLGYHHHYGKVNPYDLDPHWNFTRELTDQDPVPVIQKVIDDADIERSLAELFPQVPMYPQLKKALAHYRELDAAGGWPTVTDGPLVKPGDTDARLPSIRERLRVTGDFTASGDNTSSGYDQELEAAVRRFQSRHGLDEDGVMGPATFDAMNVPSSRRVEQIRASLERARWVVQSLPQDYIVVNIAGFNARLVRDRQTAWETKAQVGIEYHQTPVFKGDMKYVVLNPTWTVPYSIATKEMLPKIKNDPQAYFASRNFDIKDGDGQLVDYTQVDWQQLSRGNFGYTFVQRAGPNNALGVVKFIFPNQHAVYMHDTPSKALFGRAKRAFSHGCIRLDKPLELAEILLADEGWDKKRIEANKETETVYLDQPLAVLIMYWTAEVLPDATVRFFNDVYKRDDAVLKSLDAPFKMERPTA